MDRIEDRPGLTCRRCGATLDAPVVPAFAALVGGAPRALCAACVGRVADVGALAALLDCAAPPAGLGPLAQQFGDGVQ